MEGHFWAVFSLWYRDRGLDPVSCSLQDILSPSHNNQGIELEAYHPASFRSEVAERVNLLRGRGAGTV